MSTHSSIAVFHSSIESVVQEIEKVFVIGRRLIKDYSNEFEFFLEINTNGEYVVSDNYLGSKVMVVHKEHNHKWVQIDYDLSGNVYVLDELLKLLTMKLKTYAFLAFNQTTCGDFRFAFFKNGALKRSIYQQYIECHNQIRLMDNFGKKLSFEIIDFGTPFTNELPKEQKLDFNTLNDWQNQLGFKYEDRSELNYIHLEILNFKN